jgi:DNA-binding transcriptional ArsR family regulator
MDSLFPMDVEQTVFGVVAVPSPATRIDRAPLPASPSDPSSSFDAALAHARSGKLRGHALAVLRLVRQHGRCTFRELHIRQVGSSLDANEIMRRLDTLAKAGLIRKVRDVFGVVVMRECAESKRKCVVWEAME